MIATAREQLGHTLSLARSVGVLSALNLVGRRELVCAVLGAVNGPTVAG